MPARVFSQLFNVGVVDANKLHRVDLETMRLAASEQTNILCNVVGRGFVRPGFGYKNATRSNGKARLLPFIAGQDASYVIELTDGAMRVIKGSDDTLVTRPTVTAAVTSGDFSASTGWTLAATSGQTSAVSGGELQLSARAHGAEASALQAVTINQQSTEHALDIHISRGPVTFRVGSTSGGQEIIGETTLRTGYHSIAFTPGVATIYIRFSSKLARMVKVDSCVIASAGVMSLTAPWAVADLGLLRPDQSLDVMFIAADGYKPQRIERRGATSWSIVDYTTDDGPFLLAPSANVTLIPSVLEGNGTLTASAPFFQSGHVGALFWLYHEGQRLDTYLAGNSTFTDAIEVNGINDPNYNDRDFTYTLAGTWVGTAKVQRSFDSEISGFQEFRREQASSTINITANATYIDDDNEDNVTAWFRVGFESAGYTSGELHLTAQYGGGGGFGICRVVGFTSSTVVDIEVLTPFKGNYATSDWREGSWSAVQGYPTALGFAEGRLVLVGDDHIWASISDAFDSFDETETGDSGPLLRSIALGGRNEARWILSLSNLIVGTDARMASVTANSLGDIITPDNLKVTSISAIGTAEIMPANLADQRALFVEKAGTALYEFTYDYRLGKFVATPFSLLTESLFTDGITEMAVSVLPDQRVWVLTDGGNAVCVVYEPSQKVAAFIPIETDGVIESVCVLPGSPQDRVYVSVKRTINASTVRYVEKLALDSEALPGNICKVIDSFVTFGAGSATVTAAHLPNTEVVVWMDGAPLQNADGSARTFTADNSGVVTLPSTPTIGGCVGIAYDWAYETARLEYGVPNSTPVLTTKAVSKLGLICADYVRSGVKVGTRDAEGVLSATSILPPRLRGKLVSDVISGVGTDEPLQGVTASASTDTRLRISGQSPFPLSLLALVMEVETYG